MMRNVMSTLPCDRYPYGVWRAIKSRNELKLCKDLPHILNICMADFQF